MDEEVERMQRNLALVEQEAEKLLLARHELVESDKLRNGNREALTALRKLARTSQSSVPATHEFAPKVKEIDDACRTCGSYDAEAPIWFMLPGADMFVRLPFHEAHNKIEKDQEGLELKVKKLQSFVKDKAMSLSEKGALSGRIGHDLVRAFSTLKDNKQG